MFNRKKGREFIRVYVSLKLNHSNINTFGYEIKIKLHINLTNNHYILFTYYQMKYIYAKKNELMEKVLIVCVIMFLIFTSKIY